MELHHQPQEMVAGASDLFIIADRLAHRLCRRLGNRSIHLYTLLMKDKHLGTMLVFTIVLIILFLVYRNVYFLYGGLAAGGIGIFIPSLSRLIHKLWMKLAELIGFVMNKVILGIVFFFFLTPIAFLSRLFRKNTFKSREAQTYFSERNFTYTKKSLEQLW
jgi:hypothetical protein